MATALRVRRDYESGVAKIRDLEDSQTQELLTALQKLPSTTNAVTLSSAVAAAVDNFDESDVEEIVPALLHLYSIKDATEAPLSDVAEGIARGMEEIISRRLRSSSEDREPLQARLIELLGIDALSVIARAAGLFLENEHYLTETRILTDIRPVFEREHRKAPPRGVVILHTLKISYWADNRVENFFVAMDSNDIRELLEQLEWANSKAESLKSVLDPTVTYIDAE